MDLYLSKRRILRDYKNAGVLRSGKNSEAKKRMLNCRVFGCDDQRVVNAVV
jgi:hypothetical protein